MAKASGQNLIDFSAALPISHLFLTALQAPRKLSPSAAKASSQKLIAFSAALTPPERLSVARQLAPLLLAVTGEGVSTHPFTHSPHIHSHTAKQGYHNPC